MLVSEERRKPEYPETEKPLGAKTRTNNKLNPHMTPGLGVEPRPHWWEASALPLCHPCSPTFRWAKTGGFVYLSKTERSTVEKLRSLEDLKDLAEVC